MTLGLRAEDLPADSPTRARMLAAIAPRRAARAEPPVHEVVEQFRAAMRAAGVEPPDQIDADGEVHRFRAAGERPGRASGAYRLHPDGVPAGWFRDWRAGASIKWRADVPSDWRPSREERLAHAREMRRRTELRAAERERGYAQAAERARELLAAATGDPRTHSYSQRKLGLVGDRVRRGAYPPHWPDALLVPLYLADGSLCSLEAIDADGTKRFLPGGRTAGAYYPFGTLRGARAVIVGEGLATTAAACHATGWPGAAAMSAGNLVAVARAVRGLAAPGARIVILGDNDDAGMRCSAEAARAVGGAVAYAAQDAGARKGLDMHDLLSELGADAVRAAIEGARAPDAEPAPTASAVAPAAELAPLPVAEAIRRAEVLLQPPPSPGTEYPLDALGPLAEAAAALAEGAQVAPAMAGQSLLATAALLAQGVANVRSLDGDRKPLSLFALSVAESGDGKDTADRVALAPVHEHQRTMTREYAAAMAEHAAAVATRGRGAPPPEPLPAAPYRIAADMTVEGLRRSFAEGIASQGTYSTEAGAILAGHAMTPEQRLKTAANLCRLLDRGHLSVVRGGAPRVELYGMRLSSHLLAQPVALGDLLTDESLAGIGLWPRFLLAWPPPLAPRVHRPWRAADSAPIRAYWSRCDELLRRPVPADCDDLPVLDMDDAARAGMAEFFARMEFEARRGELRDVRPFALRATELACRVSGVLTAFAGGDTIDAAAARNGCALVAHSLECWQDALGGKADPVPGWAMSLYRWLSARPEGVPLRDIPRIGPAPLRSAGRRDEAVGRLRAAGLICDIDDRIAAKGISHAPV